MARAKGKVIIAGDMQKKNRKRFLVFVVCAVILGLFFFSRSSFFLVERVYVEASSASSKRFVENSLAFIKGQNIWDLDLRELSTYVLNSGHTIRRAIIQRRWPSSVYVYIEDRSPVAQTFIENELWVVDKDGITLKRKMSALPLFWPLPTNRNDYRAILEWLGEEMPVGVNGLTWDRDLGLIVLHEKKTKIILGRDTYSINWKKAEEAMSYLNARNRVARRIDATYNNRVIVSL